MKDLEKLQTVEIEFKNKTFIRQNMYDSEIKHFVHEFKTTIASGILIFGLYLFFKEDVLYIKLPYKLENGE